MFALGRPSPRSSVAIATVLLTTTGTGVLALPPPAQAAITTLCSGYSGCAAKGMGNAGYAAARNTSYWRMYSGHNCTNYAAYRMIRAGMSSARPWSGGGNATHWGTKMSRLTNGVPRVGSVAWWKAGTKPAGSSGHVGYVERVVSANEVIVSQDSWGGDFSWTRITRSGGGWPSGFIHFKDVQLRAVSGTRISGLAKVGGTLQAVAPRWNPSATRLSYQWIQNGSAIKGATGASYTPSNEQLGRVISVRVQGTRYGYPAAVGQSTVTAKVLPGTLRTTTSPTLRGRPQLGQRLTATPGSWTPRPDAVRFRWLSGGRVIPGATRSSIVATPSLVGRSLAVQVIASRRGYDHMVRTLSFRSVAPGVMRPVRRPNMLGVPRLGRTLRVKVSGVSRGARATVYWVHARDGRLVQRGGVTYRLTPRDLGSRVVAKVRVTRPGYRTQLVSTRATAPVRVTPVMRVVAARSTNGVAVRVAVRAAGVAHLGGVVKVQSRGRVVARFRLYDGNGRVLIRKLPRGRSTVRFTYVQNSKVASVSVARRVVR